MSSQTHHASSHCSHDRAQSYRAIALTCLCALALAACGRDVLTGAPATVLDGAGNDSTGGVLDKEVDSAAVGDGGATDAAQPVSDGIAETVGASDAAGDGLADGGWPELPWTGDATDASADLDQEDADTGNSVDVDSAEDLGSEEDADVWIGGDADGSPGPTFGSCYDKCGQNDVGDCSCAADCDQDGNCCNDFKFQCGVLTSTCGDGICHSSELVGKCTSDCRVKGQLACLYPTCPAVYACTQNANCSAALRCLKGCPSTSETCIGECLTADKITAATRKLIDNLRECSGGDGCRFSLPFSTPTTCGDGWCGSDEQGQGSCAEDCGVSWCGDDSATGCSYPIQPVWTGGCQGCSSIPVSKAEKCAEANCQELWEKCSSTTGCRSKFACYDTTGSLNTCVQGGDGSSFSALRFCASMAGCFAPPSQWSCSGKCGQTATGQPCSCGADCLALGNCCSDFATTCAALASGQCGNQTCQPDLGEDAASCPADCAAVPCKHTGECPGNLVCCGTVSAASCLLPKECKP